MRKTNSKEFKWFSKEGHVACSFKWQSFFRTMSPWASWPYHIFVRREQHTASVSIEGHSSQLSLCGPLTSRCWSVDLGLQEKRLEFFKKLSRNARVVLLASTSLSLLVIPPSSHWVSAPDLSAFKPDTPAQHITQKDDSLPLSLCSEFSSLCRTILSLFQALYTLAFFYPLATWDSILTSLHWL